MLDALDALLPWDFSPFVLAVTAGAAVLYVRGARAAVAPPSGRRFAFFAGLALIYCALQTRWDYFASHMFFVHRLQHFALHDVGPFLLAFSAPWAVMASALPRSAQDWLGAPHPVLGRLRRIVFDPWTATTLFVASLCFWVWPSVHFYAMLSTRIYDTMNWSVVLLDLPFWWLILDPRAPPEARLGQGTRILMLSLVMIPMILVGAIIGLARHDLYPVYDICGRFLPISALTDQQIGGLIIWIPGSLLTVFGALVCLRRALHQSHAKELLRVQRLALAGRAAEPMSEPLR